MKVQILDRTAEIRVFDVMNIPTDDDYENLALETSRGTVYCRYNPSTGPRAVAMVGGTGGGFDSPAQDLYGRLFNDLVEKGIGTLRVQFRDPRDLEEATLDLLAGLSFLSSKGFSQLGVVGHSLGGAVAAQAAFNDSNVRTVVMLATQSYGTDPLPFLADGVSVQVIHGREDDVIPWQSSRQAHMMAKAPKELVLLDGASHNLDEAASTVYHEVFTWLLGNV